MIMWHVGPDAIMDHARIVKILLCDAIVRKGYVTQEQGNEICDNIIITYERKPLLSTAWNWVSGDKEKYSFIVSELINCSGREKDVDHILAKKSAPKLEEAKEEKEEETKDE